MSALIDTWNSVGAAFAPFDAVTFALMAVFVVGAGYMMDNVASILTFTFGTLVIFAFAVFARAAWNTNDIETLARSDWNALLALQLHSLAPYALVFGLLIALVYALKSFATR